jgi:hypothetical protein
MTFHASPIGASTIDTCTGALTLTTRAQPSAPVSYSATMSAEIGPSGSGMTLSSIVGAPVAPQTCTSLDNELNSVFTPSKAVAAFWSQRCTVVNHACAASTAP